jgi:hypothetical protein
MSIKSDPLAYWRDWRLNNDAEFREAEMARECEREKREQRRAAKAAAVNEANILRQQFEALSCAFLSYC